MKYLVKTNDISTLAKADYNRIVYDATTGIVYCKGINAYDYVDLGLPSNLKWAKCNIGANSEEEAGLYFQYGDTQGYTAEKVGNGEGLKPFDWGDYKFSIDGSSSNFSKYNASDSKTVLDPEDDAAHVNMGGNWRMPTFEEHKELYLNTDIYLVPTEGEEIQGTVQEQSGGVIINWASETERTLKGVKFYKKGDKQTYMIVPASVVLLAKVLCRMSVREATCGLPLLAFRLFRVLGSSTSMRMAASSAAAVGATVVPCVGSWLSNTHPTYQSAA